MEARKDLVLMLGSYMCLRMFVSHVVCRRNWQFSKCFWKVQDEELKAFRVLQDKVDLWINCCWIHTPKDS